jgi:hypothetical protein
MNAHDAHVAQVVPTRLDRHQDEEISATFTYRADDPYAVTAVFSTREGDIWWSFARDLLLDGLTHATGDGDVKVCPISANEIGFKLESPDGAARLVCDRTTLLWFVDQIFAIVPAGEESCYFEMDTWLADVAN